MISVNLAVINFLPLPIVDGGLFLFLVYEKLKGRPPSIAFQNAATIAGLFLIGTAFIVTFYNDVMRLIG
jgi:regulator of sigma E protease